MKQLLNELLGKLGQALLGIACLQEIGMLPVASDHFLGIVDANHEEARYMVEAARLKGLDDSGAGFMRLGD